ncbi:MAG: response regulator [Clostridium sp.]
MDFYKVMVVDDEDEIRLGIIKKINWEALGFKVVGDGENGKDALEKAEKLQPDIVLTDIKMPFMDGLELVEQLGRIMPSTRVVIFSGADDFEYAHKAIKLNVVEYILKPINSIELTEVLKRLKDKLDKEYEEKRNLETLYNHYVESLPVLREQFLVSAIEGRVTKEMWLTKCKKLGIDLKGDFYAVAIIQGENSGKDKGEQKIIKLSEAHLIPISIKKTVDETMWNYCSFVSFLYSDFVVVLGDFKEKDKIMKFIQGINEVCTSYEKIMGIALSAGVGRCYEEPTSIRFSYRAAESALDYKLIMGSGKAIYIEDVEPESRVQLQFDEQQETAMLNAIKVSSEENIKMVFRDLIGSFEDLVLPFNQYRIYLMEITTSILKLVQAYNLNMDEIFSENFNCYSYLDSFNSLEDIKSWFIAVALKVNELIKKERINSSRLLVEKAKDYVKKNYNDYDMSVEKLCSQLHVSPTYFSTIFKKETDMNFVNYLTAVRLEEAVKLLNTTDDKTYVVATKVGYAEPNYFSYVFKRKFGVSPSRYRKN